MKMESIMILFHMKKDKKNFLIIKNYMVKVMIKNTLNIYFIKKLIFLKRVKILKHSKILSIFF